MNGLVEICLALLGVGSPRLTPAAGRNLRSQTVGVVHRTDAVETIPDLQYGYDDALRNDSTARWAYFRWSAG
jgi:hypothetical protein